MLKRKIDHDTQLNLSLSIATPIAGELVHVIHRDEVLEVSMSRIVLSYPKGGVGFGPSDPECYNLWFAVDLDSGELRIRIKDGWIEGDLNLNLVCSEHFEGDETDHSVHQNASILVEQAGSTPTSVKISFSGISTGKSHARSFGEFFLNRADDSSEWTLDFGDAEKHFTQYPATRWAQMFPTEEF